MSGGTVEAPPQPADLHGGTTPEITPHQDGSKFMAVPAYPPYNPPPHLPRPPFIDVDGIANFRDIGGYPCAPYGRGNSPTTNNTHMVRRGLVYRCALPNLVTPRGMTTATEDLNITAIYDLRSTPEIDRANAAAPNPHVNTLSPIRHFTPVYADQDYGPDALARKLKWYSSPSNNPNSTNPTPSSPSPSSETTTTTTTTKTPPPYSLGFVNAYRDISLHGAAAYRKILSHILAAPSAPLVFHCTAGKDRTGVLAALMLRLCGVDDDTICWDYALTEPGLGLWRDVFMRRMTTGRGVAAAADDPGAQITPDEAARICGARSPNMRAYLRLVLDGEFGGVVRYMVEKLGFGLDEVNAIRASLVAPMPERTDGEGGGGGLTKLTAIPGWTPEGGVTDEFERVATTTMTTTMTTTTKI